MHRPRLRPASCAGQARQLAESEADATIGELPPQYQSTHRQDYDEKALPPPETLGRKVDDARRPASPAPLSRRLPATSNGPLTPLLRSVFARRPESPLCRGLHVHDPRDRPT